MKEKDPILKLIEECIGREDHWAKIFLGCMGLMCVSFVVFIFYIICESFKLLL